MKLCVIQEPPVWLDLEASMARALDLIGQAANQGAKLVVFPEAWFPGYPVFVWRLAPGPGMADTRALFRRLQSNAVDRLGGGLAPLQAAAAEYGVVLVVGYQELDSSQSGSTLFNACAVIDADGRIANNHRKLMPTSPERMVWGFGDASGLRVVQTAVGRIGTLLCWENYMPLARCALYAQDLEILCAPTWDKGDVWLATMQHISREGGCWVIGCSTPMEATDIPADVPARATIFPDENEWIDPGDAVVYRPSGELLAGPMRRNKGMLFADIDPADARASRRMFDATGHYARPDIFTLEVNRAVMSPVVLRD
ncbi:MAG: carbon-nitrogen hydrolase family protein [Burkholderiaceae bacterium]|nr:carbon-nitrogen hydrolase family protein [Burkholderiaceae bacterium]